MQDIPEDGVTPTSVERKEDYEIKKLKLVIAELDAMNPMRTYDILKKHIDDQILNGDTPLKSKLQEKLNCSLRRARGSIRKMKKKKAGAAKNSKKLQRGVSESELNIISLVDDTAAITSSKTLPIISE